MRDWLYVEDHCKAIDLVVNKGKAGEVYNVGGHNEKKNIEIVKLTISTIHNMMAEKPELRKVLKKKELDENGEISAIEAGFSDGDSVSISIKNQGADG